MLCCPNTVEVLAHSTSGRGYHVRVGSGPSRHVQAEEEGSRGTAVEFPC